MRRLASALLLVPMLTLGCGQDHGNHLAVILMVSCEKRIGESDCRTVFQLADKSVYMRPGTWGERGDTVRVHIMIPRRAAEPVVRSPAPETPNLAVGR